MSQLNNWPNRHTCVFSMKALNPSFICRSEDDDDDTKEAVDDDDLNPGKSDSGSVQNENSLSPPPQHPPTTGHIGAKKRHRSTESIDEIEVPSPKKHSQNPLGLPGANIRINSRGM